MSSSIVNTYQRVLALCKSLDWLGPLAVRIVVGASFVLSGKGKLGNLEKVTDYFTSLNIPMPHANAVFVSLVELIGGLLLILGLGTRIAALFLIAVMVVALGTAIIPETEAKLALFSTIELTYLVICVWLVVGGAGKISLDHVLARRARADVHVGEAA